MDNIVEVTTYNQPLPDELVYGSNRGDAWTYYGNNGVVIKFISAAKFANSLLYSNLLALVEAERLAQEAFWTKVRQSFSPLGTES